MDSCCRASNASGMPSDWLRRTKSKKKGKETKERETKKRKAR